MTVENLPFCRHRKKVLPYAVLLKVKLMILLELSISKISDKGSVVITIDRP